MQSLQWSLLITLTDLSLALTEPSGTVCCYRITSTFVGGLII